MSSHDRTRRLSTVTSTGSGPTFLGTGRCWAQRTARYGHDCWQPAHPAVGCAIVSPSLYLEVPVYTAFRGLIGKAKCFDVAVSDADTVQALPEFVRRCPSGVAKSVHFVKTFGRVILPPCQLTDEVAHIVATS